MSAKSAGVRIYVRRMRNAVSKEDTKVNISMGCPTDLLGGKSREAGLGGRDAVSGCAGCIRRLARLRSLLLLGVHTLLHLLFTLLLVLVDLLLGSQPSQGLLPLLLQLALLLPSSLRLLVVVAVGQVNLDLVVVRVDVVPPAAVVRLGIRVLVPFVPAGVGPGVFVVGSASLELGEVLLQQLHATKSVDLVSLWAATRSFKTGETHVETVDTLGNLPGVSVLRHLIRRKTHRGGFSLYEEST